jgi:hypothetical protein
MVLPPGENHDLIPKASVREEQESDQKKMSLKFDGKKGRISRGGNS